MNSEVQSLAELQLKCRRGDNNGWLEYENKNIARGFLNICGVDEAGRGPLAGPVCAAAVILPENTVIEGVNVQKSFLKKRERLCLM